MLYVCAVLSDQVRRSQLKLALADMVPHDLAQVGSNDLLEALIVGIIGLIEAVIVGSNDLLEALIMGTKDLLWRL
jgi:hypothetical protein